MKTFNKEANQDNIAIEHDKKLSVQLKMQLVKAGCFKPVPLLHILHMLSVVILYFGAYVTLLLNPTTGIQVTALVVLAFSSVQAGCIAHEASHGAITKKRWLIKCIGHFFNTFLLALSYSHFKKSHSCHHSHCNEQDEDTDLQSKIFSLYPEAMSRKSSVIGRFISRYQAYLLWPLISLQGFALKIDSLNTLRKQPKATRIDQFVLVLHILLWFGLPGYFLGVPEALTNYILMTWLTGPYLGAIFLFNHLGTQIIGPDIKMSSFDQKLITTRNLGKSKTENIIFGGISNHIEHHLFPSIPTIRLPKARIIVRDFCNQHRLPYQETSWQNAAKDVFTHLDLIAQRVGS